jgi:hypothetical protein
MSLILLSYASLINKEGIGMRKKSKGGLASSISQPVAGRVCYIRAVKVQTLLIGKTV